MYLEDIIKQYGMVDYYDGVNNVVYELSKAEKEGSRYKVAVRKALMASDGKIDYKDFIGYAYVEEQEE